MLRGLSGSRSHRALGGGPGSAMGIWLVVWAFSIGTARMIPRPIRVVGQIRKKWKRVPILVRGDSGFCRDAIMGWCERQGIDYVFGLAKNPRLLKEIAQELKTAEVESNKTGKMARIFKNLRYQTIQ